VSDSSGIHAKSPKTKCSGQNLGHHPLFFHAGQALVEALIAKGKAGVVDTHAVHNRGVEIIHMAGVLCDVVTEIVRGSEDRSSANPAPGHPHAEVSRMVVTTVVDSRQSALGIHRASEFSAPHHEGTVQQSPLFQILQECCRWLIHV
jgi:hypothetical protein